MTYRDQYKSIQLNLSKARHQDLIDWLYELCDREERSINSFIIKLLKEERERQANKEQSDG